MRQDGYRRSPNLIQNVTPTRQRSPKPAAQGPIGGFIYAINLVTLRCDFFDLTDVRRAETWRRFPVAPGDIIIGHRAYSNPNIVRHVVAAGGDVVVRLDRDALPLRDDASSVWMS